MADAEVRKRREQAGLETPLVYAVNDVGSSLREKRRGLANASNRPPEDYGRKVKTQRNWRGLAQAVEYAL
jgi:hypothetical protein